MIRAGRGFAATVLLLVAPALGFAVPSSTSRTAERGINRSPSFIDNDTRMDANNLDMFVTNHGSYAYDLITGNAGLIFPKGSTQTAVFAAGTWVGALVNGQVRVALGEYSQEYVPGPMMNGTYQPDQLRFRSYKILRGNTTSQDYLEWPVQDGAPLDGAGNPLLLGDATIWSVFNDADPARHTNDAGSTAPLGLEIQQTTFAYNRSGGLGNIIFVKLKLRNRGSNQLNQVYASLWSDPDLGGFTDDLVGCDTTLALGYCYNATNQDQQYGASPPAVGFQLLQGPTVPGPGGVTDTLGMTAFGKYINGTDPTSEIETYNILRGLNTDGTAVHEFDNPAFPITRFQLTGNPVSGSGWLDSNPGDRRMQVVTGPFTMAPGDEQEIVGAVLVGQGSDRLSSISAMRQLASVASLLYGKRFSLEFAVTAPTSKSVVEGGLTTFNVITENPGAYPITLTAPDLPLGATFTDNGDGTGEFRWAPTFDQAGEYSIVFTAERVDGSTASATTRITVLNVNRAPTADAGGSYSSFIGIPVPFDGSGSSDPDGDVLTYAWVFGDGTTGVGSAPMHAYAAHGTYDVSLVVSDGALTGAATTTVSVLDALVARVFTVAGNRTIRLGSGKATWCGEIEPVGRSFDVSTVDLATVVMKSPGTGSVSEIHAMSGKSAAGSDRDGNGVAEITACFRKEDLRLLFANVQGQASVPVVFEGNVSTGGFFRAPSTIGVQGGGGPASLVVSPTPLRTRGAFEFATTRPGRISIRLFDVSGRLVRTLTNESNAAAGYRRIEFDAKDDGGAALGAGIYFYRVQLPEGVAEGRLLVIR